MHCKGISMYASINRNLESQLESLEMFEVLICCLAIVCAYMHSLHAYTKHSMHFCMTERSDISSRNAVEIDAGELPL